MNKMLITIGMVVGSTVGAFLPQLWGDADLFSVSSIVLSVVFGIVGIWLGYKLARQLS